MTWCPRWMVSCCVVGCVVSGETALALDRPSTVEQTEASNELPALQLDHVQFSATGGLLYFFDPETQSLHLYNSSSGRYLRTYQVTAWGDDLTRQR